MVKLFKLGLLALLKGWVAHKFEQEDQDILHSECQNKKGIRLKIWEITRTLTLRG